MRISLLATGGTISTKQSGTGAVPALDAEVLAAVARQSGGEVLISARNVSRLSSRSMTPASMWDLACAVEEEIRGGSDGVVITHGTDTLEETAYALSLLVRTPVPVVLTGAMRVPGSPGEDGPANLAAAVAVAATPRFSAYGPVVVHQDEIHLARWVAKVHSTRVAAFGSPPAGPVGMVIEGRAVPFFGPLLSDRLPSPVAPCKRVELLWFAAGSDGFVVNAIKDRVDGLVIAGAGGGHVSPPLAEALVEAATGGVAVVLASRCASAQVLRATYGGVGGEIHLLASGLVSAGSLSAVKARLRLIFGLSAGLSPAELFVSGE
ncbi:MAG: asparaginase [Castellaniella sp.]|uniref:asparaginase n=1 Tax=Castellaniella sp. TaxID=1955812 RepID=UPI00121157F7|nr:asparaginase [Castellaniella sp.]TAN30955.1 MAG: asparaginase [Castellaniella sp.]